MLLLLASSTTPRLSLRSRSKATAWSIFTSMKKKKRERARTAITLFDKLVEELGQLRTHGLADPQDRLHQCRALLQIASFVSNEPTDLARVEAILQHASARLGTVYAPAVRELFELTDASRGKKAPARHKLAYQAFCAAEQVRLLPGQEPCSIAFSTFSTHREEDIITDLAAELVAMFQAEQRRKRQATVTR